MAEVNRLAIIGSGEFGLQVRHYSEYNGEYKVVGFFDDYMPNGSLVGDLPVLGNVSEVAGLYSKGFFDSVFVAIGYKHLQAKKCIIESLFKSDVPLANIIASPIYIDNTATIGRNVMIYPGCILDKNARVGDGCTLNLGVTIAHDSTIGACCFLAPTVSVAGFTSVGDCCFLGIGSRIIDNLKIGHGITLGAGAVVTKDILCEGTYFGIPAKAKTFL